MKDLSAISDEMTVNEIVHTKPEAIAVFARYGIDTCCGGALPIAEVARQVDSAVRYSIRNALGRDVTRLTIHVDGLRYQPGDLPATPQHDPNAVTPDDLAASGTDVA
jgi:regulator of cell morphogenesis and NO signaling